MVVPVVYFPLEEKNKERKAKREKQREQNKGIRHEPVKQSAKQ